jgi:hypothetical protein
MLRRLRQTIAEVVPDDPAAPAPGMPLPDPVDDGSAGPPRPSEPGLAALPIIGITRRRMAIMVAALLAAWVVMVFVRQGSEASAATTHAADLLAANATSQTRVAALERELELIARQRYVDQQARGYGLGTPREIPFVLAPGAPALPEDAPGSAALRVGVVRDAVTPLESWLTVLFGPEG